MEAPSESPTSGSGEDTGAIEGTVTTTEGQPIAEASVMVERSAQAHRDLAFLTNAQGRYRLGDLLPGEYEIRVEASDRPPQAKTAQVEAGRVTQLDFSLPD